MEQQDAHIEIQGAAARRRRIPLLLMAGGLLLAPFFSCDESLPPPEDPLNVVVGNVALLSLNGMVNIRDGVPLGGAGVLSIVATNVHDEVLDDSAAIEVNLELSLKEQPDVRVHVQFGAAYLNTPGILNRGILTLRPNLPMSLYYPWNHRAGDGTPFWDHVPLKEGFTNGGVQYCQSDTVTIVARGSLRLFPHIAPVPLPDHDLRFVYRIYDYSCPSLAPELR